jgi:rhamnosyltransferase
MPTSRQHDGATPRVAVLLATHNGRRWLPEQLESILAQQGVEVRVVAMDDGSTDGTVEWLAETAAAEQRVTVLQGEGRGGSAAGNFYRLIRAAEIADDELVALADQDDLWMPGKLHRHAAMIASRNLDGVSSNVTSFTPAGKRTLILKSFPQREFDYLLESPGPGSTFLITPRLIALAKQQLAGVAAQADYHDWLLYALARASGWGWYIDDESTVDYRQHDDNAMGANVGTRSAVSRLKLIRERWHRGQAILLARVGREVAPAAIRPGLDEMLVLLEGPGTRLALARRAGQLRRRPRDQRIIGALIALGIW